MSRYPTVGLPPKPQSPLQADPAELLALRCIVMVLVADRANEAAVSGSDPQSSINQLAVACHEMISTMTTTAPKPEKLKAEAMDRVNGILGGVRYSQDRSGAN